MLLLLAACTTVSDADIAGKFAGDSGAVDEANSADGDTGDTSAPLVPVDVTGLPGRVYGFDLGEATIEEPAGLGAFVMGPSGRFQLLEVASTDSRAIDILAGLSASDASDTQDLCSPTTEFSGGDLRENPVFEVGPEELNQVASGMSVVFFDVVIGGMFDEDLAGFSDGTFEAVSDTRYTDANLGEDEGYVCDLMVNFDVECEACSDGLPYCVFYRYVDITAEYLPSLDLVEVASGACD